MKKLILMGLAVFLIFPKIYPVEKQKRSDVGTITLSGAWALYPMAIKWAEEYGKIHPEVRLDIQAGGAGKGMADVLSGMVDIGMVSREIYPVEVEKGAFAVAVTKDAVVATANVKNPLLSEIMKKGITRKDFIGIFISGEKKFWNELTGSGARIPIRVFTRSDACGAAQTWAMYLGKNQEDLKGIGVYGDPGLAEAVRREALAIGYNNINYAYDADSHLPVKGIVPLPIDLNGNGMIDEEEAVYENREMLIRAISKNIYPSPPARDLYFVTKGKPEKERLILFLEWVLGEGQRFVEDSGYIPLSEEKLEISHGKIKR